LHHGVLPADTRKLEKLSVDEARDLVRFAGIAPFGKTKLVVARLDGASEAALNALLKLLEEPPPTIKFILLSVWPPLDTITSRCHVYRLGLLRRDELFDVLVHRMGMAPAAADTAAGLGRGQVQAALTADQQDVGRAACLSVLKAIHDRDSDLLEQAASRWDENAQALLLRWCVEAITGRWQAFTEAETFGLTKDPNVPRRVLLALRLNARPKLAVRAALEPLLSQR
jgi:hypothetical protein